MPVTTREECHALAHDLAQPVSALQCALEVALMRPRTKEDYRTVLEESLLLSQQMDARLRRVRERSVTEHRKASVARVVANLMEELRPAASLLATELRLRCEAYPLNGDGEGLKAALELLLHDIIATRSESSIVIQSGEKVVGCIHVRPPYPPAGTAGIDGAMRRKWKDQFEELAAECEVRQTERTQVVEVRLSAHRQDALVP